MIISNNSKCPNCGGNLKYYDKVKRTVKTKGGNKQYIKVRRFVCNACESVHRELPDFIFPYKHYDGEIIRGVKEGLITPETFGFEDYPCEMTMNRWINS